MESRFSIRKKLIIITMKYTITAEIKKLIQATSLDIDTKDKLLQRKFITYDDLIKIYEFQISSGDKDNNILSSFGKLTPIFTHNDRSFIVN